MYGERHVAGRLENLSVHFLECCGWPVGWQDHLFQHRCRLKELGKVGF